MTPLAELLEIIETIEGYIDWHADMDADAENLSPEDMHAHCNGLALRELAKARKIVQSMNKPTNTP